MIVLFLFGLLLMALSFTIQFYLCSHIKRWFFKLIPLLFFVILYFTAIFAYPSSPYGCGMGQLIWFIVVNAICISLLLGLGLGWLVYWLRRDTE